MIRWGISTKIFVEDHRPNTVRFQLHQSHTYKLQVWRYLGILRTWRWNRKTRFITGTLRRLEPVTAWTDQDHEWYTILAQLKRQFGIMDEVDPQTFADLKLSLQAHPFIYDYVTLHEQLSRKYQILLDVKRDNVMYDPLHKRIIPTDIFGYYPRWWSIHWTDGDCASPAGK